MLKYEKEDLRMYKENKERKIYKMSEKDKLERN